MARQIIGASAKHLGPLANTLTNTQSAIKPGLLPQQVADRLREKRATCYVHEMTRLDAGGHAHNAAVEAEIVAAIRNEFPEVELSQQPIGIVSRCYLGAPYEVHTLDVTGGIVMHYRANQALPELLERARSLASHRSYAFIEVYPDCLRAVSESGAVSVICN